MLPGSHNDHGKGNWGTGFASGCFMTKKVKRELQIPCDKCAQESCIRGEPCS